MSKPVQAAADLFMSHGLFLAREQSGPFPTTMRPSNGLAIAEPGVVAVCTGIHTGSIHVEVALHDSPPPTNTAEWDEVVELSVQAPVGEMVAQGIMDDPPEALPALTQHGPGIYRLRIHARGRDNAVDMAPDHPSRSTGSRCGPHRSPQKSYTNRPTTTAQPYAQGGKPNVSPQPVRPDAGSSVRSQWASRPLLRLSDLRVQPFQAATGPGTLRGDPDPDAAPCRCSRCSGGRGAGGPAAPPRGRR